MQQALQAGGLEPAGVLGMRFRAALWFEQALPEGWCVTEVIAESLLPPALSRGRPGCTRVKSVRLRRKAVAVPDRKLILW